MDLYNAEHFKNLNGSYAMQSTEMSKKYYWYWIHDLFQVAKKEFLLPDPVLKVLCRSLFDAGLTPAEAFDMLFTHQNELLHSTIRY